MERENHVNDICNVTEGDTLTITTTDDVKMEVVCTRRDTHNAPDPEIIRETTLWTFDHDGDEYMAQRIDGIAGRPGVGPFPRDIPVINIETEEKIGYIKSIKLMGVAQ